MTRNFYYIVMAQKDMLENEVLEEILRERASSYISKKKQLDFWLLISPKFLRQINTIRKTNFFQQHKSDILNNNNSECYGCLISLDKDFIKWIELRLGFFEDINNPLQKISHVSNGITGQIYIKEESPLIHENFFFHSKFIAQKFKKASEIFFSSFLN